MQMNKSFIFFVVLFLLNGCLKPPKESNKLPSELVELIDLDSSIHLDIKYATKENLVGKPVYAQARAFLQKPAALSLINANKYLQTKGYGLLVFDGYRPWSVTKTFWQKTSEANKKFVADPRKGSRHNRGCAIDLTLYDLNTGIEIPMPGTYDEMSERSYPNYTGGTAVQTAMRDMLRAAMEAEGFTVYDYEWWHFDYKDWRQYPILNIPFESIP